jgi:hypothetical protein
VETSKLKVKGVGEGSEVEVMETIKYHTANGLIIPGILFHFGEYTKLLLDNFEKSLGDFPNYNAIVSTVDFIEGEINKARSIMKHGFIYSEDLTDEEAFPIISNLIENVLIQNEINKDLSAQSIRNNSVFDEDKTLTPLERLNNASAKTKAEVFKQVYHLLCLNY